MQYRLILPISLALLVSLALTKEVGIFYWTWIPTLWPSGAWATPQLGYYDIKDPRIIDQHTDWLTDAGVTFVLIDWSNNCNPYGQDNPDFIEDGTVAFVQRQRERKDAGWSYL